MHRIAKINILSSYKIAFGFDLRPTLCGSCNSYMVAVLSYDQIWPRTVDKETSLVTEQRESMFTIMQYDRI